MAVTFDWMRFLDSNHISYAQGTKGNVETHCPFCGAGDHSNHMSISTAGRGWNCWRNPAHKGVKPTRLVQAMLKCTWQRALDLTGETSFHPVENLLDKVKALHAMKEDVPDLELPPEFKPFVDTPSVRPFNRYLHERGFKRQGGKRLPREMYYATRGDFAGRIIVPVRFRKRLVGWTGRSISLNAKLRYKDEGSIKDYLPWYNELMTTAAKMLVLTEGPFDALKVQFLGGAIGVTSTCFFTAEPSTRQLEFLHELLPRFEKAVVLLDRNTLPATMRLQASLRHFKLIAGSLPAGVKDPGQIMTRDQLLDAINP